MNDNAAMSDKQHDSCPQISVHVLIYNGSWERVRATLNSVIMQKGIDFEVLVIDDCSDVNLFDKVKDFFSRHNFTNYRLIVHKKNLGTVATCLEAAQESRAEYTRGLGQGDMFFDEYTLRDSYNYITAQKAQLVASRGVHFKAFSNPVELLKTHRDYHIDSYETIDSLREASLINHLQFYFGASFMYERNAFIQYLTEAVNKGIKYTEDTVTFELMAFDRKKISFFDKLTVYHEYGIGISTSENAEKHLERDLQNIDDMIIDRCKASLSDEFSRRCLRATEDFIQKKQKDLQRHQNRQKLKRKLGVLAFPLLLPKRLLESVKTLLMNFINKDNVSMSDDVNVPTDFANLCINRE